MYFLPVVLGALLICESIYYYSAAYQSKVNGWEVYSAIKQSKKVHKNKKKLILGDSVAMQLFPCDRDNDSIISLACNQAVSLAGYYFLLTNYVKENREDLPEEVILLINPLTLRNDLDQFAFHYFLKPFYNAEYKERFSGELITRCKQIPFYWASQIPFIRSSSYSISYDLPLECYHLASPITQEYFRRILVICSQTNIAFRLVSVPVNIDKQAMINDLFRQSIDANELPEDLMRAFQQNVSYYPSSDFKDKIHLTDSALVKVDRNKFIQ